MKYVDVYSDRACNYGQKNKRNDNKYEKCLEICADLEWGAAEQKLLFKGAIIVKIWEPLMYTIYYRLSWDFRKCIM